MGRQPGAESLREAGEEGEGGGISKGGGSQEKWEKCCNIGTIFAMGKAHTGGKLRKGAETRSTGCRRWELQTPYLPPPPHKIPVECSNQPGYVGEITRFI